MSANGQDVHAPAGEELVRHPSLDEASDPAIRIVEHDRSWAPCAEEELERLGRALGPIATRLEHVGSTAVPGLAAKPIIDLQVSVASLEPRHPYIRRLEEAGYAFVPDPASPDHHFFAKPLQRPRSHHIHLCEAGSDHEFRHVAVRDFLREHRDEAVAYAALKRELARRHPGDRLAYISGKERFVVDLELRAVQWATRRSG